MYFLSLSDSVAWNFLQPRNSQVCRVRRSPQCLYICSIDPCPTDAIVALSEDEGGENDEDDFDEKEEDEGGADRNPSKKI